VSAEAATATPTVAAERREAPAALPAAVNAAASYALEVPGGGAGQVLLGDFASPAEAEAHGQKLMRLGVITKFRVVAVP
jgi:hypothetical protein